MPAPALSAEKMKKLCINSLGSLGFAGLGFTGICISNPLAWALALGYCAVMVYHYLPGGRE